MTDLSTLELLLGTCFTGPDDNPNFYLPDDAMRAAAVGEDREPAECVVCLEPTTDEALLCAACLANEDGALERDREENEQ